MATGKWRSVTAAAAPACSALASCISAIAHDPTVAAKAAKAATEFAQTAFVDRDYPKAHASMAPRARTAISLEKLTSTIPAMHPKAYPTVLAATEYEPIPGQQAMNIFVKGEGGGEEFFYRLAMEGDSGSGYRVAGFARGNGPNPSKNKRPLTP